MNKAKHHRWDANIGIDGNPTPHHRLPCPQSNTFRDLEVHGEIYNLRFVMLCAMYAVFTSTVSVMFSGYLMVTLL